MKIRPASSRHSGFTLLEAVISMLLLAIVVGMVFGTAKSSLGLANTIVKTEDAEMERQAFFDLLSQRFSSLPGDARFDLKVQESGNRYISDLTLQNVPMTFTWGGQERTAKAVQLSTVERRSGYLDIVLRFYENEILADSQSNFGTTAQDNQPFAEIVLLQDVAYFEWQVLDGNSMEWQYDWDIQGRLPLQLELTMAIGAKGEEMRQIFWIPPKQNPEVVMRQIGQSGANGSTGTGTHPVTIPGGGTGGVNIHVPPVGGATPHK